MSDKETVIVELIMTFSGCFPTLAKFSTYQKAKLLLNSKPALSFVQFKNYNCRIQVETRCRSERHNKITLTSVKFSNYLLNIICQTLCRPFFNHICQTII